MKYLMATLRIVSADDLADAARDLLAAALGEAGFESFEYTPSGLVGYIQAALYAEGCVERAVAGLVLGGVEVSHTVAAAPDEDWNAAWERQGFGPIEVAGRILVYDAKRPADGESPLPVRIAIDARQAFGTGTHQTTRMVLAALAATPLDGLRALDCGCGTGILSIAAARLGAAGVDAYDIDSWSVANTRHNAAANGVAPLVRAVEGDARLLGGELRGPYGVVMANINRNILLSDLPRLCGVMAPGATLLVSGFYRRDVPLLLGAASGLGLSPAAESHDGEWACLALRRAQSPMVSFCKS